MNEKQDTHLRAETRDDQQLANHYVLQQVRGRHRKETD